MKALTRFGWLTSFLVMLLTARAEDLGKIVRPVDSLGFMEAIKVSVTGFSGDENSVLLFDLSFMGFEIVAADKAQYTIQKNNAAGVGAQITNKQRETVYNKAFTGGGTRQQTHALADDIALSITQKPGIAQTRVAFKNRPATYGPGEIFIADYDGFNPQAVTKDGAICAAPSWAGRNTLFYMSHKTSDKPAILSHNLATGARKSFAHFPGLNSSASVSPDGRRVAMIVSQAGSPDLWVGDVDGGNVKQLTMTKEDESSPCWSPDGSTICFVSRQGGRAALYTIPASGGTMQRLAIANASSPSEPDWSPDGKYLVYTVNRGGFEICIAPMEGPLKGTSVTLVAGEDPVWAPNSRTVMFVKKINDDKHVLALLDVPSKRVEKIGKLSGDTSQPSWAR